jgi:hypothetical protein
VNGLSQVIAAPSNNGTDQEADNIGEAELYKTCSSRPCLADADTTLNDEHRVHESQSFSSFASFFTIANSRCASQADLVALLQVGTISGLSIDVSSLLPFAKCTACHEQKYLARPLSKV